MITYRIHGFWLGPIITIWSTETEEEFKAFCEKEGFEKDEKGVYRNKESNDFLEIRQTKEDK